MILGTDLISCTNDPVVKYCAIGHCLSKSGYSNKKLRLEHNNIQTRRHFGVFLNDLEDAMWEVAEVNDNHVKKNKIDHKGRGILSRRLRVVSNIALAEVSK